MHKQTYKQTDKIDLVLQVTPPDVGHLTTGTGTKHKEKSENKKRSEPSSSNLGFFELCLRQAKIE